VTVAKAKRHCGFLGSFVVTVSLKTIQISLKRKAAEHELVIEGWIGYPNKRLFLPRVFSIYWLWVSYIINVG